MLLHTGVLLGALGIAGAAAERFAARRGPAWAAAVTAVATYVALGGTSLARTGAQMASLLETRATSMRAARLLPSLCGRDPAVLDVDGLTRAALESVAENTSDAQVAPLLWAAVGGVPAVLVYRGANTLDAMIGHRSPRYVRFGWAAARFDDAANFVAARVTAVLVAACAPVVGGSAGGRRCAPGVATRPGTPAPTPAWWRRRSPGRWASGLAGRRSMPTSWRSGRRSVTAESPEIADLRRAVRLSRAVQALAALVAAVRRLAQRRRP